MLTITSRDNKLVKHIAKLCAGRKYRYECKQFVTEGEKLCIEAMNSLGAPAQLLITADAMVKANAQLEDFINEDKEVYLITEEISSKITETNTPQGVYCVWNMIDNSPEIGKIEKGKLLILSGLQDPGNIGTIIRSCEAFGLDGIILSSDCPDIYSPKVLRAAMGGVFRLPIYVTKDISVAISSLKMAGFDVYAACLNKNSVSVTELDLTGNVAVAIGNEGNGLSQKVIDCCDKTIIIEMKGNAESLNAATAASVIAWEMVRNG